MAGRHANVGNRMPGSPLVWMLLCGGVTAVILCLSLMPAGDAPSGLGWDKLDHAGAIAAVTLLAYLSLQPRSWAAAGAFLYGMFLGILIELLQATLTTSRSAEWSDIAADLTGAGFVWGATLLYQRKTAPKP